jgi:hypothetical protein
MTSETPDYDAEMERASERRSYIALAFVAIVVVVGVWIASSLRSTNRAVECLEQGRHNCVPLDTSVRDAPRP